MKKIIVLIFKFLRKIKEDETLRLSAEIAFYIILGIFPFIILIISVLSRYYSYLYYIIYSIKNIVPSNVYTLIINIADSAVNYNRSYLSVSIFALLWSSSSISSAIIRGINRAYNYPIKKGYFVTRITGILFTVILIFLLHVLLAFVVAGRQLIMFFEEKLILTPKMCLMCNIFRFSFPFIFLFIMLLFIYKLLPYEKVSFMSAMPGAIFSSIGGIMGSYFLSVYTSRRITYYYNIYGNLSGVFVFILWIYLTTVIFMIGTEINSFISVEKKSAKK